MSHTSSSRSNIKSLLAQFNTKRASELSNIMINNLKRELSKKETSVINANFIREIMNQGAMKFFIVPTTNLNEPSIGVMSKNLKSIMYINLNTTHKKFLEHYNSPYILDLLHIHSFHKGEGGRLMEAFLQIQKNLNIPGSLWTESIENVSYFEKFGFVNLGKLGDNSEFLMKLPAETDHYSHE